MLAVLPYVVCLCGILFFSLTVTHDPFFSNDTTEFNGFAHWVSQGQGFRATEGNISARREPAYILAISAIYRIFGENPLYVQLFNMVCVFVGLFFLLQLCKHFQFNEKQQCLVGILYATYTAHYLFSVQILSETFLLMLFCLTMYCFFLEKFWLFAFCSGITIATKGTFIVMPFILISLKMFFERVPLRKILGRIVVTYAIVFMVLSPWIIRNYSVFHQFIYASSGLGRILYISNLWEHRGNWFNPARDTELGQIMYSGKYNDVQIDTILKKRAIEMICKQPGHFVVLCGIKAWRFWSEPVGFGQMHKKHFPAVLGQCLLAWHWIILLLAFMQIKNIKDKRIFLLFTLILFFYFIHIPSSTAVPRYHYPLMPFIYILVVMTLTEFFPGQLGRPLYAKK